MAPLRKNGITEKYNKDLLTIGGGVIDEKRPRLFNRASTRQY
jgi:hypothetical protein